jgi:hypothetical protein
MNIAQMTITAARVTNPTVPPQTDLLFPVPQHVSGSQNGRAVSVSRQRVFETAVGALTATTVINQVQIQGRYAFQIVVELGNSDSERPMKTRDTFGEYVLAFTNCVVLPVFGLSLGGEWNFHEPSGTTTYKFPKWDHPGLGMGTTTPTHATRTMRFLAIEPLAGESVNDVLRWLTNIVANSAWSEALINGNSGDFDLPLNASLDAHEPLQPESAFSWHQANPRNLWGFRDNQGGAGDDLEFGTEPYPALRFSLPACLNLLRRLTGYAGHQPMHMYDRRYVETPNEEAWKFTGALSEHSRNLKGLPSRHDPEFAAYREGWVAGPETIEHCSFPQLWLAWRTMDPALCEQAVDIAYYLMNTIHRLDVGIYEGGYDCPLKPIPRCHRLMTCLIQAQMVCEKWGQVFEHAAEAALAAKTFIENKILELHASSWRQDGYPDYAIFQRPDGKVNGKIAIAAWQGGFPIQVYWWVAKNIPHVAQKAKDMLREWTQIILAAWQYQPYDARMKMGKLIAASPMSTPGWPAGELEYVHVSLDGLVTWPYAGLKLARGYHADLFTAPELHKLDSVIANLEEYWPELITGKWGNIAAPEPVHQ